MRNFVKVKQVNDHSMNFEKVRNDNHADSFMNLPFLDFIKTLLFQLSFVLFVFFILSQAQATKSNDLTAILSLKKGAQVQEKDLKKILKHPLVLKYRDVFTAQEKKIIQSIKANYLNKSWVLTLRDEKSFDLIEKLIRREGLPLNLDWNDLRVSSLSDPFEGLQWGLNNTGVAQAIDLDPVMTFRIPAVPGQDIHLAAPSPSTKKTLVAVLDTGFAKLHPDLFRILHRNPAECQALEKFQACLKDSQDRKACEEKWMSSQNPEVDTDQNGYPLDCSGWSLLGGINAANIMGRPDFDDDQGHGSHVAGIIGAEANNQEGVRGVTSNVEILPVQVVGDAPTEPLKPLSVDLKPSNSRNTADSRSAANFRIAFDSRAAADSGVDLNPKEDDRHGRAKNGLSDLVARGVIYAIKSGAQVMSFSLGWPQATDSEFMRSLITEAQNRGIIIVAAAGNDSTRALLRPCAYAGVICVGATGPDGGLAHFSNFGSGVDIAAPGVNILSTYPMLNRPVRFRQTLGYEYLSGTSQATPFVTGVVADLLSRGIPASDIYARIVLGARPLLANQSLIEGASHVPGQILPAEQKPYEKFVLSGQMDMVQSLNIKPQPLIVPYSKEKTPLYWNRKDAVLSWTVPLQNRWADVPASTVQLSASLQKKSPLSIRPEVVSVLPQDSSLSEIWKQGEIRNFVVQIQINDDANVFYSRIPSDLELRLAVSAQKMQQRSFILDGEIIVPVSAELNDPDVIQIPIADKPTGRFDIVPVDENLDGVLLQKDYFLLSQLPGSSVKYQVYLMTQKGTNLKSPYQVVQGPKIMIEGDEKQIRPQIEARIDRQGLGKREYILGFFEDKSESEKPTGSPMSFYIFDEGMKLVDSFKYDSVLAQIPFSFHWQKVGQTKMPAWIGYGKDPSKTRGLRDRWENPDNTEKSQLRFYYLDADKNLKALQKFQDYLIVDTFQPTQAQLLAGEVPILLAKNKGTSQKPSYLYDFAVAVIAQGQVQKFMPLDFIGQLATYRNILDTRVDKVNSLDPQGAEFNGSFWFGEGQLRTQRLTLFNSESLMLSDQMLSALRSQFDSALWVRAVFAGGQRQGAFVLTNSEIQYHDLLTRQVSSVSFERYTFFPDLFMTNAYFPLVLKDSTSTKSKLPGLFTTEESELNRGVKMLVPVFAKDGSLVEIVSPARLRLMSSRGCRPLSTPVFMGDQGSAFDYYCGDRILRIPLSY